MDHVTIAPCARALLALITIGGGIYVAVWGARIFRESAVNNNQSNSLTIQFGKFKAHGKGAGATVLASACLWVVVAGWMAPSLRNTGGETVADAQELKLSDPNPTKTASDPDRLASIFTGAVRSGQAKVSINGATAKIDSSSVIVSHDSQGRVLIWADAKAGAHTAAAQWVAKATDDGVEFKPLDDKG